MTAVGERFLKYGGETACVEIEIDDGTHLVMDLGTGSIPLGQHLVKTGKPHEIGVFLSHTHLDHVQGLPFFLPALVPGWKVTVHGPSHAAKGLDDVLNGTLNPNYSPLYGLGNLGAEVNILTVADHQMSWGSAAIDARWLPHGRVRSLGYRITIDGKVLAYLSDCDYEGRPPPAALELAQGADLLIHDAMNLPEEQIIRRGWGHSSPDDAIQLAELARVKKLLLFHHDPWRDDEAIEMLVDRAELNTDIPVTAAKMGDEFAL